MLSFFSFKKGGFGIWVFFKQFGYFVENIAHRIQTVGLWLPDIKCKYALVQCYYSQLL